MKEPEQPKSAAELKVCLIRWLLPQLKEGETLASELRYSDGQRRADLAVASPTRLCAYEIKGDRDNLSRLFKQLQDYEDMFLETYLVVASKYSTRIQADISSDIGIIEIKNGSARRLRKAHAKRRLTNVSSARWLDLQQLRRLLKEHAPGSRRTGTLESLRGEAVMLPNAVLNKFALRAIADKLQRRHVRFIGELGAQPTLDDLMLLSAEDRVVLGVEQFGAKRES